MLQLAKHNRQGRNRFHMLTRSFAKAHDNFKQKKNFHMTLILEVFELAYKKLSQSFEL